MITKKYAIMSIALIILIVASGFGFMQYSKSQRDAHVTPFWSEANESSTQVVDHQLWQTFLDTFIEDSASGINLVDYARALKAQTTLAQYIESLENIDARTLNREEQKAYWINAYNALTVQLILAHYPTDSILDLGDTLSSIGPWDDHVMSVATQELSLNDIEHRILRPIWKDPRIHFAVNCASIGCPNLQASAFTSDNTDDLLDEATEDFVNHPRGIHYANKELTLSSIFDWYGSDFGNNLEAQLSWLSEYAEEDTADILLAHKGAVKYQYDWKLNKTP